MIGLWLALTSKEPACVKAKCNDAHVQDACSYVVFVTRILFCAMLVFSANGIAQEDEVLIRGLTVYGMDNETTPPIIVRDTVLTTGRAVIRDQYITIQFDVVASDPPPLRILFLHCDRNWVPDNNLFVQDEQHNTSFSLDFRTSPGGVSRYRYRYANRFPDERGIVQFRYSGNWMFRIVDKEEKNEYGAGRFFVVDDVSQVVVTVKNEYHPDKHSPLNQVNKVLVTVTLPQEVEGIYYSAVDVYQNRRFYTPYRIDSNDRDPFTFVSGQNSGKRVFSRSDIQPGNEYRMLDLGNATRYPNGNLVRPVGGVDQQRNMWRTGNDRNGIATLSKFTGNNSDYLEVLFRLQLTDSERRMALNNNRGIFLVSQHNAWSPGQDDELLFDKTENAFSVRKLLRRGIYDYQYITGVWNPASGEVMDQDWLVLEGNDWRTSLIYTAFVYYDDPRFGGFTRIVGYGTGVSSATAPGTH